MYHWRNINIFFGDKMKVKQLIAELRKLPQNLTVGVSAHDNYEEECSGWVCSVTHFIKNEYDVKDVSEKDMFNDMPEKCIILNC